MRVTTPAAIPLALAAAAAATLGYLGPAHAAPDSAPTRLAGTLITPALDTTPTHPSRGRQFREIYRRPQKKDS